MLKNYNKLRTIRLNSNPELLKKRRKYQSDWAKKNPEHWMIKNWKKQGIKNKDGSQFLIENYNNLLIFQNKTCAICKTENPGKTKFVVDHDHKTGVVRGLLCQSCNMGIGLLRENKDIFMACIEYLNKTSKF